MYCMFKKLLALSFFSSLVLGGNGWETFFLFLPKIKYPSVHDVIYHKN